MCQTAGLLSFPRYNNLLLKILIFLIVFNKQRLVWSPHKGCSPVIYGMKFGVKETRPPELPNSEKPQYPVFISFDSMPMCETPRQTGRSI